MHIPMYIPHQQTQHSSYIVLYGSTTTIFYYRSHGRIEKSASTWSIPSVEKYINKTQTHMYMKAHMNADTFMQTLTLAHTGAIKACFMTLMNGFWILYPVRWVQTLCIGRHGEGHAPILLTYKLTSTDISTLYHTCSAVACMHAGMYKYTQGPCLSAWGSPVFAMINRGCVAPTLYLMLSLCWSWKHKQAVSLHDTDKKNSLADQPACIQYGHHSV